MWKTSLLDNISARHDPSEYVPIPTDLRLKCLESAWFKDINRKMTKAISPSALVGFDYFEDMFDPFDIDEFELERFMLRVFKVLSMILLE